MITQHLRRWGALLAVVTVLSLFSYWWFAGRTPANQTLVVTGDQSSVDGVRPRDFTINRANGTTFHVEWKTETPSEGYVLIGETPQSLVTKFSDTEAVVTSNHTIRLFDLQPGRKYYYVIVSNGMTFGRRGEPLQLLTTP